MTDLLSEALDTKWTEESMQAAADEHARQQDTTKDTQA